MVIAIHEAGHACIARSLGHEVIHVSLDSIKVRYRYDGFRSHWIECVIALSGPAAETRYGTYSADEIEHHRRVHWWQDIDNAEGHLRELNGVTFAQIENLARHLVEQHWTTITRVAEALVAQSELKPFELDRLRRGQ
jgi:hypothetical protein